MAYYCKGKDCEKAANCLRVKKLIEFPNDSWSKLGSSVMWLLDESICKSNDFSMFLNSE